MSTFADDQTAAVSEGFFSKIRRTVSTVSPPFIGLTFVYFVVLLI